MALGKDAFEGRSGSVGIQGRSALAAEMVFNGVGLQAAEAHGQLHFVFGVGGCVHSWRDIFRRGKFSRFGLTAVWVWLEKEPGIDWPEEGKQRGHEANGEQVSRFPVRKEKRKPEECPSPDEKELERSGEQAKEKSSNGFHLFLGLGTVV